jgi:hypothetical protein
MRHLQTGEYHINGIGSVVEDLIHHFEEQVFSEVLLLHIRCLPINLLHMSELAYTNTHTHTRWTHYGGRTFQHWLTSHIVPWSNKVVTNYVPEGVEQ